MRSFSLVPGERRHHVDPGKAVEEARSGPGGGGRPSCREGAGGVVRASAAVRGRSNRPPQRWWRRRDPGPAASAVPFVALGAGGFLERPVIALGCSSSRASRGHSASPRASSGSSSSFCSSSPTSYSPSSSPTAAPGGSSPAGGYKEYRLGDYSTWMQRRVEDSQNWAKIRSCLQDGEVCQKLAARKETVAQFINNNLSPIQVELQVFRKELDRSESFTVSIPAHTGGAMPASSYSDQSLTEDDALLCLNTKKTRLSPQCTTSSKTATIGQSEEETEELSKDKDIQHINIREEKHPESRSMYSENGSRSFGMHI